MSEYKEIKQDAVSEPANNYYGDYEYGEVKEQLTPGIEVSKPKTYNGTADTSSLDTANNVYNLSVPNPSLEMFSIGITHDGVTIEQTFYYANSSEALCYELFEADLQEWLGIHYVVEYVSGTNFTIQRNDGQEFTIEHPELVRQIELIGTNEHSLTDITIDGVTTQLDGSVYTTDALAIEYLTTQLSPATYHLKDSGNDLYIARKDAVVPVITVTNYDRYTYVAQGSMYYLGYIYGCHDIEKDYQHYMTVDGMSDSYTLTSGLTYDTSAVVVPLLNTPLGNYSSGNCHSHGIKRADMLYDLLTSSYTKTIFYQWGTWSTGDIYTEKYGFDFHKNDYSAVSITQSYREVNEDLTLDTGTGHGFALVTSTNNTTVNVTTHTEITITLSTTSNNYFIPVPIKFSKITMNAISTGGSSEGIYEYTEQSCTASYSTTKIFVDDKIFKTDASNYGDVLLIKTNGFIINLTRNKSNKLTFTCS